MSGALDLVNGLVEGLANGIVIGAAVGYVGRLAWRSVRPPPDRLQAHSNSLDQDLAPWRGHGTGAVFPTSPADQVEPFAGYAGYVADGQAPESFYPPSPLYSVAPPGDPRACRECWGLGGDQTRGDPNPCERCGRRGRAPWSPAGPGR